jgi:hypothetical protein
MGEAQLTLRPSLQECSSATASAVAESPATKASPSPWLHHLQWFAGGSVAAFLVPLVFSSLLELHHDAYLGVYFAFVIGGATMAPTHTWHALVSTARAPRG